MPKFKNPIESALSASLICLQLSKSQKKGNNQENVYYDRCFPIEEAEKKKIKDAGLDLQAFFVQENPSDLEVTWHPGQTKRFYNLFPDLAAELLSSSRKCIRNSE